MDAVPARQSARMSWLFQTGTTFVKTENSQRAINLISHHAHAPFKNLDIWLPLMFSVKNERNEVAAPRIACLQVKSFNMETASSAIETGMVPFEQEMNVDNKQTRKKDEIEF